MKKKIQYNIKTKKSGCRHNNSLATQNSRGRDKAQQTGVNSSNFPLYCLSTQVFKINSSHARFRCSQPVTHASRQRYIQI